MATFMGCYGDEDMRFSGVCYFDISIARSTLLTKTSVLMLFSSPVPREQLLGRYVRDHEYLT